MENAFKDEGNSGVPIPLPSSSSSPSISSSLPPMQTLKPKNEFGWNGGHGAVTPEKLELFALETQRRIQEQTTLKLKQKKALDDHLKCLSQVTVPGVSLDDDNDADKTSTEEKGDHPPDMLSSAPLYINPLNMCKAERAMAIRKSLLASEDSLSGETTTEMPSTELMGNFNANITKVQEKPRSLMPSGCSFSSDVSRKINENLSSVVNSNFTGKESYSCSSFDVNGKIGDEPLNIGLSLSPATSMSSMIPPPLTLEGDKEDVLPPPWVSWFNEWTFSGSNNEYVVGTIVCSLVDMQHFILELQDYSGCHFVKRQTATTLFPDVPKSYKPPRPMWKRLDNERQAVFITIVTTAERRDCEYGCSMYRKKRRRMLQSYESCEDSNDSLCEAYLKFHSYMLVPDTTIALGSGKSLRRSPMMRAREHIGRAMETLDTTGFEVVHTVSAPTIRAHRSHCSFQKVVDILPEIDAIRGLSSILADKLNEIRDGSPILVLILNRDGLDSRSYRLNMNCRTQVISCLNEVCAPLRLLATDSVDDTCYLLRALPSYRHSFEILNRILKELPWLRHDDAISDALMAVLVSRISASEWDQVSGTVFSRDTSLTFLHLTGCA